MQRLIKKVFINVLLPIIYLNCFAIWMKIIVRLQLFRNMYPTFDGLQLAIFVYINNGGGLRDRVFKMEGLVSFGLNINASLSF